MLIRPRLLLITNSNPHDSGPGPRVQVTPTPDAFLRRLLPDVSLLLALLAL